MPLLFSQQLDRLRDRVARLTSKVQSVVELATQSLYNLNVEQAEQAILSDARVDLDEVEVEKCAIDLLALHHPAAGDLRFVTSVIKVNSDFERIGDCAVNVAQRVAVLARRRELRLPADLVPMANIATKMLRDTVNAFNLNNVELARQVIACDDSVNALYHQIVQTSLVNMEARESEANRELALIMIAKNYERIGDHCTNIAEDIIYIQSGQIVRHLHSVQG